MTTLIAEPFVLMTTDRRELALFKSSLVAIQMAVQMIHNYPRGIELWETLDDGSEHMIALIQPSPVGAAAISFV